MGSTESKPSIRRNDSSTSSFGRLSYPSPRYHVNSPGCIKDLSRLRQKNRKAHSDLTSLVRTSSLDLGRVAGWGRKDFSDRRRQSQDSKNVCGRSSIVILTCSGDFKSTSHFTMACAFVLFYFLTYLYFASVGFGLVPFTFNIQEGMQEPQDMRKATKISHWGVFITYILMGEGIAIILDQRWLPFKVIFSLSYHRIQLWHNFCGLLCRLSFSLRYRS